VTATDTLAYYNTANITAVKGFIVQAHGCLDFIEAFFKQFMSEVLKD
jgi:hypothetical protein